MRIAVVGLGMAGSTFACLPADRDLDVTVIEPEDEPSHRRRRDLAPPSRRR